jgi:hypothetical protein
MLISILKWSELMAINKKILPLTSKDQPIKNCMSYL